METDKDFHMHIRFYLGVLLAGLFACDSVPQEAEGAAEAMPGEVIEASHSNSPFSQLPGEKTAAHIQHMQDLLTQIDSREEKGALTTYSLALTGITNPEVSFFEGKVQRVRWNDTEAGVNGSYTVVFEDDRIPFWYSSDHGMNWFMYHYSYTDYDLGCIPYIWNGELPGKEDPPHQMAVDEKVVEFSCQNQVEYLARKLYQVALHTYGNHERFYKGKIAGKHVVHLKWERAGEKLTGAYHYDQKDQELGIAGYQMRDSVWLTETWKGDTTGFIEGTLSEKEELRGYWYSADRAKKMPINLQRQSQYFGPGGEISYSAAYGEPLAGLIRIDDRYLSYDGYQYLRETHNFRTTSAVETGDNDFRALYDYFEYAMLNTITPDDITLDDEHPRPTTNYLYFINLPQPDFVPEKERNDGYYSHLAPDFDMKRKLFAYLIKHASRDPETIQNLFRQYSNFIYDGLNPYYYKQMQVEPYLEEVLAGYDSICAFPQYEERLATVWHKLDSLDQARLQYDKGAYGRIDKVDRSACFDGFKKEGAQYVNIPQLDFWARRQHEGNMRTVHSILVEIKSVYDEGKWEWGH